MDPSYGTGPFRHIDDSDLKENQESEWETNSIGALIIDDIDGVQYAKKNNPIKREVSITKVK